MNKKFIVLLTLLTIAMCDTTVSVSDQCTKCTQFKSLSDCQSFGCTWTPTSTTTPGSCGTAAIVSYIAYCPGIANPATTCASTYGCAYVEGKCIHFAGCSAYVKTSTAECQAIQFSCISDGTVCMDAQACSKYTTSQCSSTPDLNGRKCTLDAISNVCRNYTCAEADATYITTTLCNAFTSGCVSTGAGCVVSPLPACSSLTGTDATCLLMTGNDGKCKLNTGTTNCTAQLCTDAPITTMLDSECKTFKNGCVTTGKGCIATLGLCASYTVTNPTSDCNGYVGTDGVCEGDSGTTVCRGRKCENGVGATDPICVLYKVGCLSNGKTCVSAKSACSGYTGTTATCVGFIGTDGNCKGTSATVAGACTPKLCDIDSSSTYNTDLLCSSIQASCKSTGLGCVSSLLSCTTYTAVQTDGSDCLARVGSEGKCKAGTGGKCAAKACSDAPISSNSNVTCNTFKTGCVTNGAGCQVQASCINTVAQTTCQGTTEGAALCNWNPICVPNGACSSFPTQAICASQKQVVFALLVSTSTPCIWDTTNNLCRTALCTDYTGASYQTDTACSNQLTGCVTNGINCVLPSPCSNFKGLQATCLAFKANCTNTSAAAAGDSCVQKTCGDIGLTYTTDSDCGTYLSGCLTNGNGCILNSSNCSAYSGTQAQCDKFYGHDGGTVSGTRCWNLSPSVAAACLPKVCTHATLMTSDPDCNAFLTGCLYDGNGSCVLSTAACTSYTGSSSTVCGNFKGNSKFCWWTSGTMCIDKTCTHQSTATSDTDCGTFLTGCLTSGTGCISPSSGCGSYQGVASVCNNYTGNSIKCTRLEACVIKTCSAKTNAVTNADCLSYHTNCRLQQGTGNCIPEQGACTGYASFAVGAIAADLQTYCNSLTITDNATPCAYNPTVTTTCVTRTCWLWTSGLTGISCTNYLGADSCKLAANGVCYLAGTCGSYNVPTSVTVAADKITWCNNLYDNTATKVQCTNVGGAGACVPITTCEMIASPTSAAACNTQLAVVYCQYYGGKCITTATACTGYSLTGITTGQAAYCSGLKSQNAGTVTTCKYDAGTTATCIAITTSACAGVVAPTKQSDCDLVVTGCKYYSGACYIPAICTSYSTPSSATTETLKRLYCQNMVDTAAGYCSFPALGTGTTCAIPITDCTSLAGASLAACGVYRMGTGPACSWLSTTPCAAPVTDVCPPVIGISTASCDLYTTLGKCVNNGSGTCVAKGVGCVNFAFTGTSADEKATSCQAFVAADLKYCSWISAATCETSQATCAGWASLNVALDNTAFCELRNDLAGNRCTYDLGVATCRQMLACEDAVAPQSKADCDRLSAGCTYFGGTCYVVSTVCGAYLATGATDAAKLAYCNGLSAGSACTFLIGGTMCVQKGICSSYTGIAALTGVPAKTTACSSVAADTDAYGCTYWVGVTANCVAVAGCNSYTGSSSAATIATDCAAQKGITGKACIAHSNNTDCAAPANCEAITGATSQADCDKLFASCVYTSSKCFTNSACGSFAPGGSAVAVCAGLKDSTTKQFCKATLDADAFCAARTCADVSYPTHAQCQSYMTTCISNGTICINASTTCASQSGNPNFCQWALDTDGVSTCMSGTASLVSASCADRTCAQNVVATTDSDCASYLKGCLTQGVGCIVNSANCNKYFGITSVCQNFTGHDGKCWGSSATISGVCRVRQCSDNTSANLDADCDSFQPGCLTNGAGCISASSPCSSYKGTQATCKGFKGSSKTILCWNTVAATSATACVDRVCTQLIATSDSDCAAFIPAATNASPNCVTNGTNCVAYPQICSFFKGTLDTCPNFTASDGPCKTTTYSNTAAFCTQKVCTEAPNSMATDADCKKYHPSCATTGRGCVTSLSITCAAIQASGACGARQGCVWANQCRLAPTTCSTLTGQGQSICTNSLLNDGITKCAWAGSTCRNFLCTDYDATFTTHTQCYNLDKTCTTSGAGCVSLGACISYTSPSICAAANTSDPSIRCTWDKITAKCLQRQCTDFAGTTDADCDTFLTKCRTSGTGCVGPTFSCSVFTSPQFCKQDGSQNPCLFVGSTCYNYSACTSVAASSLSGCQTFNSLCVPSLTTCIAQTSCAQYTALQSCSIGINSSQCGWLPTGKCQVFGACTDAVGTSNSDCYNYGATCITDGAKCIAKGTCSSYATLVACGNYGSDGLCTWVAASSSCRLAICSDKVAQTDSDCQNYIVPTGKCTTDGLACSARGLCTAYSTAAACTIGSDGIPCIFTFVLGSTTGVQSCRAKECSDIIGLTNDSCVGQINAKPCVSNGKVCVKQDVCANYKNKLSCNGGGSDGVCAFSPAATTADPFAGSCQLFSSCDKANSDSQACNTKSAACQWTSTVSGTITTTSCAAKNCVQAASGSTCNYIPSFDGKKYTICSLTNSICTANDPSTLLQPNCYSKSAYTYTWSESSSKCVSCTGIVSSTNNTTTTGNTTTNSTNTTTTNGYILGFTIPIVFLGLFA